VPLSIDASQLLAFNLSIYLSINPDSLDLAIWHRSSCSHRCIVSSLYLSIYLSVWPSISLALHLDGPSSLVTTALPRW